MPRTYSKYQYETSPRKLEPEYTPKKEPYKKKKTSTRNIKKEKTSKEKVKQVKVKQRKTIKYITLGFIILFAITYRHAQIDENFSKVQELKATLDEVKKENTQLEIDIADGLNFNNLEQQAKELLGMQKLTSQQTTYINLPKTDYIETAAEEVIIGETPSFFESLLNTLSNILK